MENGHHIKNLAGSQRDTDGKLINTKSRRDAYRGRERTTDEVTNIKDRYRIPPDLIKDLFSCIV